ncbi:TetR/AcrR family transcriptional regulator [Comamonas humi]
MTTTTPTPTRTRRTQEERRASSELALIDAAVKVMRVKGVTGLTLAEVAEIAGVSKGLVVHLYGSKQGLQLAVLDALRTEFSKRLRGNERGARSMELLRSFIRMFVGSLGKPTSNTRVFSALLSEAIFQDQEFAAGVAAMNDATIDFVRECLAAEQARGLRFIDDDLDSLATLIVAHLRGIAQIFSINASAQTRPLDTQKLLQLSEALLDRMVDAG